jgi:hypothetical protein
MSPVGHTLAMSSVTSRAWWYRLAARLNRAWRRNPADLSGQHASPCPTRPGGLYLCLTPVGFRHTVQGFGHRSPADPTRAPEG